MTELSRDCWFLTIVIRDCHQPRFEDMVAAVSEEPVPNNAFGIPLPPELNTSFDTVIIIDGLPIAPVSKFEKLVNLIRKAFLRSGNSSSGSD